MSVIMNLSENLKGFYGSAKSKIKPKKHKVRRTEHKGSNNSNVLLAVYLVMAVLFAACFISLTRSQISISKKQKVLDELNYKIDAQVAANAEVQSKLNGSLDEYIEDYARDKLDMVKPGERVYINTAGD